MFALELDERERSAPEGNHFFGTIKIGSFKESFRASSDFWGAAQYLASWRQNYQKLLDGESKAAFITSITDPETSNFLFWWVAYKAGNKVFFQNQILFLDKLDRKLDLDNLHHFVRKREKYSEDGDPISEWRIAFDELKLTGL